MKTCSDCQKNLPLTSFGKKNSSKDGLNYRCKSCYSSYMKVWYSKNSNVHKARVRDRVTSLKQNMWDFYLKNPCVDCGQTNPVVLHADHVGEKTANISDMVNNGLSWKSIQKELEKCQVRCANCHAIKTARDFDWYGKIQRWPVS